MRFIPSLGNLEFAAILKENQILIATPNKAI